MSREGIFTTPSQSQSSYAVGTNIIKDTFILYSAVRTLGGVMPFHRLPSPTSPGDGVEGRRKSSV